MRELNKINIIEHIKHSNLIYKKKFLHYVL